MFVPRLSARDPAARALAATHDGDIAAYAYADAGIQSEVASVRGFMRGNLGFDLFDTDRLFEILRDPLRSYLPSDSEYDRTFDWFEYLLCLCHCDAETTRTGLTEMKAQNPNFTIFASVGRFGWKDRYQGSPGIREETELQKGEPYPEKVAAVINAGFFESAGQHDDKYREVKAAFDRHLAKVSEKWV